MTVWGFVADIHGNLPMFERALRICREWGAEEIVALGDTLGRGDSAGAVRLLKETVSLSVVGNRDRDWADRVDDESRAYVSGLPAVASASDFLAVHGDRRITRDLYTSDRSRGFERLWQTAHEAGARCVFFGHTHQPSTWRKNRAGAAPEPLPLGLARLDGPAEAVFVVYVGTVGLPFPGRGPASCALYDDTARTVQHLQIGEGRGAGPAWAAALIDAR
jgi:predicted phosphodiesterase